MASVHAGNSRILPHFEQVISKRKLVNEKNYLQTWFTTDISIEKPKNFPFCGIEAPRAPLTSWTGNFVVVLAGGAGGLRTVGLYAAAPVYEAAEAEVVWKGSCPGR